VNFTVKWETDIRRELHYLWAYGPDPAAVRAASDTAEERLAADPFGVGQHVSEGLWRLSVPPLLLHYEIDKEQQVVKITGVMAIE
jgi:hypothetical protein